MISLIISGRRFGTRDSKNLTHTPTCFLLFYLLLKHHVLRDENCHGQHHVIMRIMSHIWLLFDLFSTLIFSIFEKVAPKAPFPFDHLLLFYLKNKAFGPSSIQMQRPISKIKLYNTAKSYYLWIKGRFFSLDSWTVLTQILIRFVHLVRIWLVFHPS